LPACIAGIASILFAVTVGAQTPAAGTNQTGSNQMGSNNATARATAESVSRGDRKFMEKAAQGGIAEVELGKLAAQKAASPDVKQFGQRMVDDHSKANDKLKSLATSKGVNLPTGLDRSTQRELDKLSKLSGAEFDREYMKHMVSDHKKDVSEFKSEAKKAKDADVKDFAATTLPTLEEHLKLAQAAEQSAKNEGRAAATSSNRASAKTGS
jgi:putative membrane protein